MSEAEAKLKRINDLLENLETEIRECREILRGKKSE